MIVQASWSMAREFCDAISYEPSRNFKAIVLLQHGRIVAATGYDRWTPNCVQMHIWIPGAATRRFVRESFRYPFEIAGKSLAVGVTPSDNTKALEFNKRIGFKEAHRIVDGWSTGVDMVIQELRKSDCKWIRQRVSHGNRCNTSSAEAAA